MCAGGAKCPHQLGVGVARSTTPTDSILYKRQIQHDKRVSSIQSKDKKMFLSPLNTNR